MVQIFQNKALVGRYRQCEVICIDFCSLQDLNTGVGVVVGGIQKSELRIRPSQSPSEDILNTMLNDIVGLAVSFKMLVLH